MIHFLAERVLDIPKLLRENRGVYINTENTLAERAEGYLLLVRTPPSLDCTSEVFVDNGRVNDTADACATDGVLEKLPKGREHERARYCLIGMMRARKGTPSSGRNTPGLF